MSSLATVVWTLIFVAALAFEAWTIWGDRQEGTTLSAHVWRLRTRPVTRALLVASAAWLVYHFFFEAPSTLVVAADDWMIVATGFFGTLVRATPVSRPR